MYLEDLEQKVLLGTFSGNNKDCEELNVQKFNQINKEANIKVGTSMTVQIFCFAFIHYA